MKDHNTASSVVMERCNVCSTEQSEMSSPQFITFLRVHFHYVQNLHLVEIQCYVNGVKFISLQYLCRMLSCDNRNEGNKIFGKCLEQSTVGIKCMAVAYRVYPKPNSKNGSIFNKRHDDSVTTV